MSVMDGEKDHACCFLPVARADARVLILGSVPGRQSLERGQYYAHPRNAFWRILAELLEFDAGLDYRQRLAALKAGGVALWDVMAACRRPGSLDADIVPGSVEVNDFNSFLADHPQLKTIFFNGRTAEIEFKRRVVPVLCAGQTALELVRLPSTSPAMASLNYQQKKRAWRQIVAALSKRG